MYKPKYFTLEELCKSEIAERKGINNFPSFEAALNLLELTEEILDPLREAWGGAVYVRSGFRCEALNDAVGGSKTSAHPLAYAADLYPANGAIDGFIAFARGWLTKTGKPFDQFIEETDGRARWLHIGLYNRKHQQRRQFLNITKREAHG